MLVSFFKFIFFATSTSLRLEWNCLVILFSYGVCLDVLRLGLLETLKDMLWLRLVLFAEADSHELRWPTVMALVFSKKIDGVLAWPLDLRWLMILYLGSYYILDTRGIELLGNSSLLLFLVTTLALFIFTGFDSIFAGLSLYFGEFYLVLATVVEGLISVFLIGPSLLSLSFAWR